MLHWTYCRQKYCGVNSLTTTHLLLHLYCVVCAARRRDPRVYSYVADPCTEFKEVCSYEQPDSVAAVLWFWGGGACPITVLKIMTSAAAAAGVCVIIMSMCADCFLTPMGKAVFPATPCVRAHHSCLRPCSLLLTCRRVPAPTATRAPWPMESLRPGCTQPSSAQSCALRAQHASARSAGLHTHPTSYGPRQQLCDPHTPTHQSARPALAAAQSVASYRAG
jgi:hypothetical protein